MKTRALVVLISLVLPAMADREAALSAYERQDFATAFKQWQWLADEGDAEAEYRLGTMYEKGEGVFAEPGQAAKWYRKSADQGYSKAQYALGKLYAEGRGALQDYVEAHKWLNLASSNGEREAAKQRDRIADKMTPAQVAEAQRLAKEWKPALPQTPPAGNTGDFHEALRVGNGVSAPSVLYKVDPDYSDEARHTHISGTVLLDLIVRPTGSASDIRVVRGLGSGLDEKAVEAVSKWKFRPGYKDGQAVAVAAKIEVNFRLLDPPPKQPQPAPAPTASDEPAAEPNSRATATQLPAGAPKEAHEQLAIDAFKRGDYATAYREWLPLAQAGDPWDQVFLASLYYLGRGVARNFETAVSWLRKAAETGNPGAYETLAACYQRGYGVGRDYVEAQKWFMLAGPPDKDDAEARADVLAHLSQAERERAAELAFEWLASKGFPFVTRPTDGALVWASDSLVHPVATSARIIPEKGIQYKGVAVYANVTRDKGTLWSNVTVWNVDDKNEIGIDPNHIRMLAGSTSNPLDGASKGKSFYAVPPAKAMSAGRTSATIQALILSLGSNRRTASVTGVDTTSGDIYSGTVTYTDPELERQRADAVQSTLDRQAAAEQQAASVLLWPTVLKTAYYIRGGVEFRKIPKDATHILLIVPIGGVLYNLPFVFQRKDDAGR